MLFRNESSFDRALRIVIGTILLALVFVGPHTPWGWLGLVAIATGAAGYCPLYQLVGAKTCATKGGCCS
jgi:hypothetical protein